MRRVTSPTGIIYTARFHRGKLLQTIYKLRVTTVHNRTCAYYPPKDYYSAAIFYGTIYPSGSTNHDSFVPSGSRREHPFIILANCARLHVSFFSNDRIENNVAEMCADFKFFFFFK